MKDEEIKKLVQGKKLAEPDFEWTRIKSRVVSEHKALKLSICGVFATLLIIVSINVYNQNDTANVDDVISYMFEDGYFSTDTTYDYVDL